MQALPPGKSDCSNSFRQPRNHYVHLSAQLTTTARLLLQRKRSADERPEPNWIPWIIGVCLASGSLAYVFADENMRLRASPASMAAGPEAKVQDTQLKACPNPPIWNKTMTTPATDGKMLVNALYHSAVV